MLRRSFLFGSACVIAARMPAQAEERPDMAVLPAAAVPALLRQCSRAAPPAGEDIWEPGWKEIDALEALLPAALARQAFAKDMDAAKPLTGWYRQYVGIVRDARRFVYGNYFPARSVKAVPPNLRKDVWRSRPQVVCDGGPAFFGVEYDVAADRLSHLAFNGPR